MDRFVPLMVIQVPGAIPGRKLAPFTTPPEAMEEMTGGIANAHAAPTPLLSQGPPKMAVLASADSATEKPCCTPKTPKATSLSPCWAHTSPERVYTNAPPILRLSPGAPTMAVLPSADSATAEPWFSFPTAALPASLPPCWVHR